MMPSKRTKLLSSSRPPANGSSTTSTSSSSSSRNLSSRRTRSVIRLHHMLQKQLAQAVAADDTAKVTELAAMLDANGGLTLYQRASTQGQSKDRGGDTSRVLVEWLRESGVLPQATHRKPKANDLVGGGAGKSEGLRILEVGALSTQNALNIPGVTRVRRIDLHSQHPGIEEVDFMHLDPGGEWEGERGYDVLSLSLVVNFVGDPGQRGEMLRHTVRFLRHDTKGNNGLESQGGNKEKLLPALFLVLPLPCVDNSRYLTEEHLTIMMESLGYEKIRVKRSGKLYYSLWQLRCPGDFKTSSNDQVVKHMGQKEAVTEQGVTTRGFKKKELRKGKDRNNFCIVLDDDG